MVTLPTAAPDIAFRSERSVLVSGKPLMAEEMATIRPSAAENQATQLLFVAFQFDTETVFSLDDSDFMCDLFAHMMVSPST
jgi:hypothetical protein